MGLLSPSLAGGFLGGLLSFGRSVERSKNKKTRLMLLLAMIQTDATLPKNEGEKRSDSSVRCLEHFCG
ncbi:uncharacterized [Tachysurus ichikawai]